MEFPSAEPAEATQTTPDLPISRLSIDGVANAQGSGAGLILTSLEGKGEGKGKERRERGRR